MALFKRQEKTIPDGKYRIIKIGKDALFEFLYESIIDNQECYFDVSDGKQMVTYFDIDWENGEFICVARSANDENECLQCDIDTKELLSKLQNTTDTMYDENRFIEMTKEEIINL